VSNLNPFQRFLANSVEALKEGARKSERATRVENSYSPSAFNVAGKYSKSLREQGVNFRDTPMQALGALGTRLVTDVTNDGTRRIWWSLNVPPQIAGLAIEKTLKTNLGKENYKDLGKTKTGIMAASVGLPVLATTGSFNIFNPGEQFRATGYAQTYSPEGAQDRRETEQPAQELFDRLFLARQGRPLKYETAKQEIPSLTPERYGNFMKNYYQNSGFLGVLKATPENLEGIPEARLLGFPVNIATGTTLIGGMVGLRAGLDSAPATIVPSRGYRSGPPQVVRSQVARRTSIGGAAGALAGAAVGATINATIAQANRPKLPTVAEYSEEMQ
jgi:hypothetical protein